VVFTVVTVGAIAASFLAPGPIPAPMDTGVCWRMTMAGTKPKFARIASGLPNLETCAAYLERIHLTNGGPVDGAFQGRFIFIDDDAIRSASRLDGSRWQVFFASQRFLIDQKLREGGRTVNVFTAPPGQGP
jgi:hypothetical protein